MERLRFILSFSNTSHFKKKKKKIFFFFFFLAALAYEESPLKDVNLGPVYRMLPERIRTI